MSKISKTARASMGQQLTVAKSVLPDAELIRLLRIDRSAHLSPGTQGVDALLRAHDLVSEVAQVASKDLLAAQQRSLDLERDLELAKSKIETLQKTIHDMETVVGAAVPHGAGAGYDPTSKSL